MKKSASLLIFSALLTITAFAQNIQEGVNHVYAERYASAKATFEKMIAANPNNMEATYWLGQTHIANNNVTAARQVYEKALASNGNAPMVLVGMGHVELIEGKTNEARQRFEAAISMSRGKKGDDPAVLNAIGRANVESTTGDVAYAISKLTAASQLAPTNGEIYINLGNAYRKAKDGGQAVTAYTKALPTNAALANYRMARVYETQRNWDVVTDYLNRAIAADPKFAPAYLRQYVYNLFHKGDYTAADEWAKKFITVADQSVQNEYFRAQSLFQQKNYNEAIQIGKSILGQTKEAVNPSVYRLMAYSYLETKDTSAAKQYVDQLFANAQKDEFVAKDYTLKATIYAKERPEEVVQIYMDAAQDDTTNRGKLLILQEAIDWAKSTGRKIPEADLRLQAFKLTPSPNPAVLFQIGLPYYQGGAFKKADSVFTAYSVALPDSIYGHYWSALSRLQLDPSMEQGLAVDPYQKTLEIAQRDARFKSMGVQSVLPLAGYYNNVKKDKETAIMYLKKGLELDPENVNFQKTLQVLQTPSKPATPAKPNTPAKPQTKSSSSSNAAKKPAGKKG
jgi:tetratricopeptide (TPR) repeat protein